MHNLDAFTALFRVHTPGLVALCSVKSKLRIPASQQIKPIGPEGFVSICLIYLQVASGHLVSLSDCLDRDGSSSGASGSLPTHYIVHLQLFSFHFLELCFGWFGDQSANTKLRCVLLLKKESNYKTEDGNSGK